MKKDSTAGKKRGEGRAEREVVYGAPPEGGQVVHQRLVQRKMNRLRNRFRIRGCASQYRRRLQTFFFVSFPLFHFFPLLQRAISARKPGRRRGDGWASKATIFSRHVRPQPAAAAAPAAAGVTVISHSLAAEEILARGVLLLGAVRSPATQRHFARDRFPFHQLFTSTLLRLSPSHSPDGDEYTQCQTRRCCQLRTRTV